MAKSLAQILIVTFFCLAVLVAVTTPPAEAAFTDLPEQCQGIVAKVCSIKRCICYKKAAVDAHQSLASVTCPGADEVGDNADCEGSFQQCKDTMNCDAMAEFQQKMAQMKQKVAQIKEKIASGQQ